MACPPASQSVHRFTQAAEAGKLGLWLASLPSGTVIYRNDIIVDVQDIRAWVASEFAEPSWSVLMQGPSRDAGQHVFSVRALGRHEDSRVVAMTWRLIIDGDDISRIDIRTGEPINLPPPAACFVEAVNRADEAGILALFLKDAVVNDELVEHRGAEQIRQWIEASILGSHMRLKVVDAFSQDGSVSVRVEALGDFGPGLPEPLILTLYFSMSLDHIAQLIVLQHPFRD